MSTGAVLTISLVIFGGGPDTWFHVFLVALWAVQVALPVIGVALPLSALVATLEHHSAIPRHMNRSGGRRR